MRYILIRYKMDLSHENSIKRKKAFLPVSFLATELAAQSAEGWLGRWSCSKPGPRNFHKSLDAHSFELSDRITSLKVASVNPLNVAPSGMPPVMALISAAKAAPSRLRDSPAPLAANFKSFAKPLSIWFSL